MTYDIIMPYYLGINRKLPNVDKNKGVNHEFE